MKKIRNVKKVISVTIFLLFVLSFTGCGSLSSIISPPPSLPDLPDSPPGSSLSFIPPLYIITGKVSVEGVSDFWGKMNLLYGEVSLLRDYPLVEGVEKYLEDIRDSNTIMLIIPPTSEGIQEFQDLEAKYPDLCSVSSASLRLKMESCSAPLLYFSSLFQPDYFESEFQSFLSGEMREIIIPSGKMRGTIVANEVTSLLAELLGTGGIIVDTFFRYDESWQLEIL